MKRVLSLCAVVISVALPLIASAQSHDVKSTVNITQLSTDTPTTLIGAKYGIAVSEAGVAEQRTPPPSSILYQGITVTGSTFNALTNDSYFVSLSGSVHNHLLLDGDPDDWNISGNGYWLPSSGPMVGLDGGNARQLSTEWDMVLNGVTQRTMLWTEQDGSTHFGVDSYSGLGAEPKQGTQLHQVGAGPKQHASLIWDIKNLPNSLGLCGGDGKCRLVTDDTGVYVTMLHTTTLQYDPTKTTTLPKGVPDGTSMWCADCVKNAITGVVVYYHAKERVWTDADNQIVKK